MLLAPAALDQAVVVGTALVARAAVVEAEAGMAACVAVATDGVEQVEEVDPA